ncbi:MAG: acyl-CoA/acyl-ACP dehydrogenase [Rhodobacteraceae bacterium]|nr:acyl-CoA/acyl-ACP dehydrogenase [Paracoccaceae bacterium]
MSQPIQESSHDRQSGPQLGTCITLLEQLLQDVKSSLQGRICDQKGRVHAHEQSAGHAFAWFATVLEALRQMHRWSQSLESEGRFGEIERLLLQIVCGEYAAQFFGGIPMNQSEFARLHDLMPEDQSAQTDMPLPIRHLIAGNSADARARLVELMLHDVGAAMFGASGLDDEMEEIRGQIRRFSDDRIVPYAQGWHLDDLLIPTALVEEIAEMGVFGLTIPERFGGAGMPKTAMCVVSEELSRGHLGVGSLATRSEIAAELIRCGGTETQKGSWLPKIACGEILPTAVFTEPGAGSDLGSLSTRAEKSSDGYRIQGSKTWITHAARANMLTLLARTDRSSRDYRGLSMFVAEKRPCEGSDMFPDEGISGFEIEVIGYRGMKEYSVEFDGFRVDADSLLGGVEGQGFRQLMETFESARIQTAARAIGVAQSALDAALRYASERRQFGKRLIDFPRVASKLALMAAEIMACRQLTYFAADSKDSGRRCDLEAGMAKMLAARVAWTAADNAVQIHGGNGFALESPVSRILCDARILSIFEGASEIQAGVIAAQSLKPGVN